MGRPHWAQSGSGSVSARLSVQAWQNGIALPVSRIWAQIRHGAGSAIEASASHIPRKWDRTESATLGTVGQAYPCRGFRGSEKSSSWHDSCQLADTGNGLGVPIGAEISSSRDEPLFRGALARVFPRKSRNGAPREQLPGAFAEAPLRTRCRCRTYSP